MSTYFSIYIPRMAIVHNDESIKNIFQYYQIGIVEYVDFTPINKKPGFGENVDKVVKSAFVHFSNPWYYSNNSYDSHFRTDGNNNFWSTINANQSYKLQISPNEYWICLKNRNPIQRTIMNIHQIVENARYLENLLYEQTKKINELEKIILYNEKQDTELILRKHSKKNESNIDINKRLSDLEVKLQGLIEDLDTYDILRYN